MERSRVDSPRAHVVAVVGAAGGCGASSLAAALAAGAARRAAVSASASEVSSRRGGRASGGGAAAPRLGRFVVLVDLEPVGGGLDLLLGEEARAGLRWPDLDGVQGRVEATEVAEVLPAWRGARLLSAGREPAGPRRATAREAVLTALREGADLLVLDLPRHAVAVGDPVLGMCDAVVLVVPCDVRGVAAAGVLLGLLEDRGVGTVVVTRSWGRGGGLHPGDVAAALECPVRGHLRHDRTMRGDVEHGLGPLARRGRGVARLGRELAAEIGVGVAVPWTAGSSGGRPW